MKGYMIEQMSELKLSTKYKPQNPVKGSLIES